MCTEQAKRQSLAKQQTMFLEIGRQLGLDHTDIACRLNGHRNTVGGWARGESEMSIGSFREICRHVPDHITSIMMEPVGKTIGSLGDDGCFDQVAKECVEFVGEHVSARSDAGPGGSTITHTEKPALIRKLRSLYSAVRNALRKNGEAV